VNQALRGTLIAGPAGAALFGSLYMDWFGPVSGWDSLGWFETAVIAGAACLTFALAVAIWTRMSVSLPVAASAVTATVGVIAFLFVVHRLLNVPVDGAARESGLWLAAASCIGIVVGGYVGMGEEPRPASASTS
jgi:hypothetical protein